VSRFDPETIAYAAGRGISADELPLVSNGCSGGLSWLYALGDKSISCEQCCHIHDIDYQLGGTRKDRAAADKRLRDCAGQRGGWRKARAWVIWAAVRCCGWRYWAGE